MGYPDNTNLLAKVDTEQLVRKKDSKSSRLMLNIKKTKQY